MDQVHMSDRGSITMRGGITDSVHYAARGAIDIRRGVLLAVGWMRNFSPGGTGSWQMLNDGIPLMNSD